MPRFPRSARAAALALLGLAAVLPLAGCPRKPATPVPDLVILASGGIYGQLAPCG